MNVSKDTIAQAMGLITSQTDTNLLAATLSKAGWGHHYISEFTLVMIDPTDQLAAKIALQQDIPYDHYVRVIMEGDEVPGQDDLPVEKWGYIPKFYGVHELRGSCKVSLMERLYEAPPQNQLIQRQQDIQKASIAQYDHVTFKKRHLVGKQAPAIDIVGRDDPALVDLTAVLFKAFLAQYIVNHETDLFFSHWKSSDVLARKSGALVLADPFERIGIRRSNSSAA